MAPFSPAAQVPPVPVAHPASHPRGDRPYRSALRAYGFVLPFALVYAVFFGWPVARLFHLSFTATRMGEPAGMFVGLAQYQRLVHDPLFWRTLGHTLYFVVLTVPALVALGLGLALLALRAGRLRPFAQAAFFLPYILPVSVVALIWGWLLNPTFGIVNQLLGTRTPWLGDATLAMPSIAVATIWWTVGFNVLLFMAGLQNIPAEVKEAARLDGATSGQVFRHITWPMLQPVTTLVLVLQVINSLKIFAQVYLMTRGGPEHVTRVSLQYMYDQGFTNLDTGYASAIGVAIFLLIIAVALLQARLLPERQA